MAYELLAKWVQSNVSFGSRWLVGCEGTCNGVCADTCKGKYIAGCDGTLSGLKKYKKDE
ncbi:MAG: hypothetical protein J6T13_09545 [Bacteroidales bacterium]|nr:hypothetical protein [Bacteroidales bacterium]